MPGRVPKLRSHGDVIKTFVQLLILAPLLLHLVAGQAVGIAQVVEVGDHKPKVVGSCNEKTIIT